MSTKDLDHSAVAGQLRQALDETQAIVIQHANILTDVTKHMADAESMLRAHLAELQASTVALSAALHSAQDALEGKSSALTDDEARDVARMALDLPDPRPRWDVDAEGHGPRRKRGRIGVTRSIGTPRAPVRLFTLTRDGEQIDQTAHYIVETLDHGIIKITCRECERHTLSTMLPPRRRDTFPHRKGCEQASYLYVEGIDHA